MIGGLFTLIGTVAITLWLIVLTTRRADHDLLLPVACGGGVIVALAMICLIVFVTRERRHLAAEHRLALSEARLQTALENTGDGIWDWQIPGDVVHLNGALIARLGFPIDTPSPIATWETMIHPEDRPATLLAFHDHLAGKTPIYHACYRWKLPDGVVIWVEAKGRVITRDRAGKPLRMIGTLTDATQLVEAEERIRENSRRLEESNRDLEQFAYVASHDLQEPLRMVSSYLGLLRRRHGDQLAPEALEFMSYAEDGAKRMSRLILDLLEYSRVTTRGEPPETVALAEVIDEARSNLRMVIDETAARIDLLGCDRTVLADRGQVVRVFQNLIGNALKYRSPERPPIITLRCGEDEGWVNVSVADNGIGFSPEHAERIFVIFQRLHGPKAYEGTGIGLSICKRIIERHGGTIEAQGTPGEGACFRFTLPRAPVLTRLTDRDHDEQDRHRRDEGRGPDQRRLGP
ncbi:sensor histidine kinase [Rhodospirillum rubrum]|uniref:sensor histidine kinase n=1 Tax=Rhodospirillum rubrum TaxID=1085 RepID=UPI0027DB0402|nr:ATP-binding protein [Rhodospirillum rubrum]